MSERKLPKLFVADIDGTLSSNNCSISDNMREILLKLKEKGTAIGLASGRPVYQAYETEEIYGMKDQFDLFVTMNGASYYDRKNDENALISMMSVDQLKSVVEIMKPYDEVANCSVYTDRELVVKRKTPWMLKNWYENRPDVVVAPDDEFFTAVEREKVMYRFYEPDVLEECMRYLDTLNITDYCYFKTRPDHLEFSTLNTNKINAVEIYCKKHNIDLADVMACGDTSNDNEMLKYAGVSICLANGTDDTKALADYVTEKTCMEDGLALFLQDYFKDLL